MRGEFGQYLRGVALCAFLLFWQISLLIAQSSSLQINEFQASNVSTITNPLDGSYADWIELYNAGTEPVHIQGWYLTDDPDQPDKWRIPFDSLIAPGEFMLIWADGHDEFIHTNFKLGRGGEFIGLYDTTGLGVDSISFGYQEDDHSLGRQVSDPYHWVVFDQPTPGSPNSEDFFTERSPDPVFSAKGGFYDQPLEIELSAPDTPAEIYYSLDGTLPTRNSPLYTVPVSLDSTMVIRARVYQPGKLPGNAITQTYFIGEDVNLPVISLATDPAHFFDDSTGIYVIGTNGVPGYCSDTPMNLNRDWERPVNVELYDKTGRVEINQMAGVKIFGGCSRTRYPQKSLALFARASYGKGEFDCQLFRDKPIYSFESFILRNSADDCTYTMFKDGMGQTLLRDMNLDLQAYRPAVVFINGEYWGIHNIREKINEHYVAGNYQVDADRVNLLQNNPENEWNVLHGTGDEYNSMISYIDKQNLTDDRVYQYVTRKMDMDNYLDYQVAQIFLAGNDWPGNNIKFWNVDDSPYEQWRWIVFDLDNCMFDFYIDRNTLAEATDPWCDCVWPNPPWSTLLFRNLLENEQFRNDFIQRLSWHMNTTFHPDRVFHIMDSIKAMIEPEIPRHIERWGGQLVPDPEFWIKPTFNSTEEWEGHIERMKYFFLERPRAVRQHVLDHFSLYGNPQLINLAVSTANISQGFCKINKEKIAGKVHEGIYFARVPLTIKAISRPGHAFSHWTYRSGNGQEKMLYQPVLEIMPEEDLRIMAHFSIANPERETVVINEINYHSADDPDPGDWVELYNNTTEVVDLTGWSFSDERDDHVFYFADGQEISPHGYLVITDDMGAFRDLFAEVAPVVGDLGFGLSNGGETIRLYGPGRRLVDLVSYDDEDPWPEQADGTGSTLELIDVSRNNNEAINWRASIEYGTPGQQNFINTIDKDQIFQNYPNPFQQETGLSFELVQPGHVRILVLDRYGRQITELINKNLGKGRYTISWDAGGYPAGMYLSTMILNGELLDTIRLILIR